MKSAIPSVADGVVRRSIVALSVVSVLGMILPWAQPAAAQVDICPPDMLSGDGMTCENTCMDDLFDGNLGCTANDVRVSGVADVNKTNMDGTCDFDFGPDGIVDECDITFALVCDTGASNAGADCSMDASVCLDSNGDPAPMLCGDRCAFEGDTTTFAATFIVELSAQARYDIGLYFAVDGDDADGDGLLDGDGALFGTCSISTLPEVGTFTRPDQTTGNFVDLDATCNGKNCPQPDDLCGDIDNANNPIYYDLSSAGNFVTAVCADPDDNGRLNLPNCTSWRQSGANEKCTTPTQAFPGSPSKCNCDPTFEVPINVPPAELQVLKTATPTSVDEPGDTVQFDIAVTNTGVDPNNNVTLNSLIDDIYGDITVVPGAILSTTCEVPKTITPGGTYTCSFNATVSGNGGDSQTDTVTASGVDDNGNPISGSDDATVDILDVLPAISVVKTADPTEVLENGGEVMFTVQVNNDSDADALELISLTDDIYFDITQVQGDILTTTCEVPQAIALNGNYTCSFTAFVGGMAGESETDTVTAVGVDDEFVDDATTPNNKVSASDTATVNINDVPSAIELIKDADPTMVDEPGDEVTYTFTVNNLSLVDMVEITSLIDDIYGDITVVQGDILETDCTVPQVLPAAIGQYQCTITASVSGDAGDVVTNVATASGVDDDGNPVSDDDDATVNVKNVPPAASLTKTATMVVATFEVVVTNDSSAESLSLDSLSDDEFGDITQKQGNVLSTTCAVPQTIAVGGSYTCTFDGKIGTSPHTDTVTGTVSDNEGGSVTPSDSATVSFE